MYSAIIPSPNQRLHSSRTQESPNFPTLLEVLSRWKKFEIFVKLLAMTSLKETLSQPGQYTLLAPTNEAFKELPKGAIETLMKPEKRVLLQEFLKTYLIEGQANVFQSNFKASNGIIYTINRGLMPILFN